MELAVCQADDVEDPLPRPLDVFLSLQPAVAGSPRLRRIRHLQSAGRRGHVVLHAHQGHDPLQLALVAAAAMQPNDQRVRVAGRVVHRSKQGVGKIALLNGKRRRTHLEPVGKTPRRSRVRLRGMSCPCHVESTFAKWDDWERCE